ncbi:MULTISPECIES: sigma-54 dependent transcriptional regulator [unclassified Pseudodesulfovibrio]|uniref:sigma-54-dependent transcriptional regulator n=1 Tax=unclassified Pseudodesulfovibrio TaxID=2661612 RepID=UPI000FEBF3B3|nr:MULTISPECIES: sigma-54 dependent transcriptional regulator [unclassified Pseudodesulfovibrio]MCJ2165776.1 sigma-54 dependent transcriptional regulator [Pseudodesulfovibrio sp. S3-i]RWU02856.1 sigma-54-dependent Fis family transcriptional regulator [Pseudodesulfovibrio sp. S3]
MSARTVLFIAEPQSVTAIFPTLQKAGLQAGLADNLNGALGFIKKSSPCLVFCRPELQGFDAKAFLQKAQETEGFPPVVIFSVSGSAEQATEYLSLGARDYWIEPLIWDKIKLILPEDEPEPEPVETTPAPRPASAVKAAPSKYQIIGRHQAVLRVLALAKQVAGSKATVLISGESGTGKEMFARYLHHNSDRTDKPFVAINCAALPEHLLESELFGHEKGAFTGAINRKLGKFELADGGTILLDEITEMDLGLQAKLLRVLQESEFDRVGGVETVNIDVRVLATTNRDIEATVKENKFRQDLYYRLNVIPLTLPALKDRGDDVLLLAEFFTNKFTAAYGLNRLAFTEEAKKWLMGYDWPGNVRELQNLMERAVLLAGQGPIKPRHFLMGDEQWTPDDLVGIDADQQAASEAAPPSTPGEAMSVMPLHEMEKRLILKSLEETTGNRTRAAELLGISVRTLRNKLNEYKKDGFEE